MSVLQATKIVSRPIDGPQANSWLKTLCYLNYAMSHQMFNPLATHQLSLYDKYCSSLHKTSNPQNVNVKIPHWGLWGDLQRPHACHFHLQLALGTQKWNVLLLFFAGHSHSSMTENFLLGNLNQRLAFSFYGKAVEPTVSTPKVAFMPFCEMTCLTFQSL